MSLEAKNVAQTPQSEENVFLTTAYIGNAIEILPESPVKRIRLGDELQPLGVYAGVDPYYRVVEDVDALQTSEQTDPEFQSKDWWWDHQRIRFLNEKLGFKVLLLFLPFTWILTVYVGGMALVAWMILNLSETYSLPAILDVILLLIIMPAWIFFALSIIPPTTNWLMSTGIGFLMKPFEKRINKKLDQAFEDGCSEFNRVCSGIVNLAT